MSDSEARQIIRSAIGTLCREAGAQFTARPVIRSEPDGPTSPEPEPLAAIGVAVELRHAAARAVSDHTRNAREDGCTWSQIGEAMGLADRPGPGMASVAERAFLSVASDLGRGQAFAWTCPSCLGVVTDCGPEIDPPDAAEHGHADGCARMAEAMRAYAASWGA